MRIRTEFHHVVQEIENTWIPMSDGARLGARIWLPEDAGRQPVPTVLEYIPYRKDDGTAARDAILHPYFAGCGYAAVRVDMRGSGDSDGILYDEYLPQEQADALEVLQWLAAQPWCTGSLGMIGKSWGGFNGLQIAARRPPQLKAVISVCSTDDIYADDVHYRGGSLLADAALPWAATMLAANARPPEPRFVGERWRAMWHERMEKTPPYIDAWVTHQRRDAFWQQGSVCEDFAAITCPVYMIGGWADPYSNAIPRTLAGLQAPCKGLIGPWSHNYPESGVPGPAIGFLQECVRWWDYWLKGEENGIMREPALRVWMQSAVVPAPFYAERPGRWVAEPAWPSPNVSEQGLYLNPSGSLAAIAEDEAAQEVCSALTTGLAAGPWLVRGWPHDYPLDQAPEDAQSLCFTSAPAAMDREIFGFPEVTLSLATDRPQALVAVRLCDVSPAGVSTLVSRGQLNLTHRAGHEDLQPLTPGQRYSVTVSLDAVAYALPAGHRWRLAVSTVYWPWAWPSPELVTLRLFAGAACRLSLPVRAPRLEDDRLPPFEPAERPAPPNILALRPSQRDRDIRQETGTGQWQIVDRVDSGRQRFPSGAEYETLNTNTYSIVEGDPLSARVRCEWTIQLSWPDRQTRIETDSVMTCDQDNFYVADVLEAYEGEAKVFTKRWTHQVARDHG